MTIDVNQLPAATDEDLIRVGQYLVCQDSDGSLIRRSSGRNKGLYLAAKYLHALNFGVECGLANARFYRLLTESQAIELAKTMPHVWPEWRATWPKEDEVPDCNAVPDFDDVRVGNSFQWTLFGTDRQEVTEFKDLLGHVRMYTSISNSRSGFATADSWRGCVERGEIRNYKRANAEAPKAVDPYEVKDAFGNAVDEVMIEARMERINDAYAERQERDKASILAQWRKPWSAGTNGMGSSLFGQSWKR